MSGSRQHAATTDLYRSRSLRRQLGRQSSGAQLSAHEYVRAERLRLEEWRLRAERYARERRVGSVRFGRPVKESGQRDATLGEGLELAEQRGQESRLAGAL